MEIFGIVAGFFIIAVVFMAGSLTFSKYKKDDSACCGGGSCAEGFEKRLQKVHVSEMNETGENSCCGKHKH